MICYRIIDALHRHDILSGRSAALTGGRWNPRGQEAVYGSATISLAILEMCCHYGRAAFADDLVVASLHVPDETIYRVEAALLPQRWMALEAYTQQVGNSLMASGAMALEVPSTVHGFERNLVINSQHDGFAEVTVQAIERITVDNRIHAQAYRGP